MLAELDMLGVPGCYWPSDHLLPAAEIAARITPPNGRALDMGTGVGALAIALHLQRPDLYIEGVDINPAAIEQAKRNAELTFYVSDAFSNVTGRFDTIMCTMPYSPLAPGEVPDLDCDCGKHNSPFEAMYDQDMSFARVLVQAREHLDGFLILFADANFDGVARAAGYRVLEDRPDEWGNNWLVWERDETWAP